MRLDRVLIMLCWMYSTPLCGVRMPRTLDDFVQYSYALPELSDWSGSWSDPDFEAVYLSQMPGVLHVLKDLFSGRPVWSFDMLRSQVYRAQKMCAQSPKKSEVRELHIAKGDRVILWGDVHGAYHSFLRDLKELEKQGIITQDLRIASGCYFIMLGDDLSCSPYALQQLSLELLLLERNPDRFFCLSSLSKKSGQWKDFITLRLPLLMYGSHHAYGWLKRAGRFLPLEAELNEFFRSLYRAVLLQHTHQEEGQIYCTDDIAPDDILLSAKTRAVIAGETKRIIPGGRLGLNFVGYDYGTTCWSLFSSPIKVYQDKYDFYRDSFVILHVGETFRDNSLIHFSRDIRGEGSFETTYGDLLTGIMRSTMKEISTIQQMPLYCFGSSVALFGGYGAGGMPIKQGIEAAVVQVNEAGGVNGYLLYPIILDDAYDSRIAVRNVRELTEERHVDVLVSPQGTPTLSAYIDRVKNGDVAVLFPRSGAEKFYNRELKFLVHSLASTRDEVHALMDQMVNEFKVKTFAFVYPADAFGIPFVRMVKEELRRYGITESRDFVYYQGQTDFTDLTKKLRESTDECVGIFMTGNAPVREFLNGLGMEFFLKKAVFTMSFLDSSPFNYFVKERGLKLTMSYPVPDPRAADLSLFQDFYKAIEPYGFTYNASTFEGYLAVRLLVEALKHIDPPFTKEAILHYFEGFQQYPFGGLHLTFNPETRGVGMPVFIITGENRWFKYQHQRRVAEGDLRNVSAIG